MFKCDEPGCEETEVHAVSVAGETFYACDKHVERLREGYIDLLKE